MPLFGDLLDPKKLTQLRQSLFAKRDADGTRPEPEPRKGMWWFNNRTVNKKQQRLFTLNAETLSRLSKSDPITWSIIRTIKSFINQAEWDIEIDTEAIERELDRYEEYALSHLSPYAVGDIEQFRSDNIPDDLENEIHKRLRGILAEGTAMFEKKKAIQWLFASVVRKVRHDAESHRAPIKKIFEVPSERGIENNLRKLQDLVLNDILIYDAGCIVKNLSYGGDLAELYHLPGKDIRIYRNEDRTLPDPPEPSYIWEDGGIRRAEFTRDELVYIVANPQDSGYGMSPLEASAYVITASIYADEYNIDFFKNSNVPPGVMDLGKDVTEDQRNLFQQMWENEVRGRGGLHRMLFISGSENSKFIPISNQTNREMQMMEYLKWTMSIKTACYGISPQDIGFTTDLHRETGQTQRDISYARGVRTIMQLLEQYYNSEIVKKEFEFTDVKFAWTEMDFTDEEKQSRIDAMDIQNGVMSRNDRRKKLGLKPADGGDALTVASQLMSISDLEESEEGREDIEEQAVENEQAGGKPEDMTETPTPNEGQGAAEKKPQAPQPQTVNLKMNRRQPLVKQHEMLDTVVKDLQEKGIEATIKIGFSDDNPVSKGK